MKLLLLAVLATMASSAMGNMFFKSGKEYIYETTMTGSAGTMDYATAFAGFQYKMTTRIQVSGRNLNVKLENMKFTQNVGTRENAGTDVYSKQKYTPVPIPDTAFSVKVDSNGLFESVTADSSADPAALNMIRAWASYMQINKAEIKSGKKGFVSREQTLHGTCDVSYTVTDNAIRKSVSHTEDCESRVYRLIDDWRGMRCDGKTTKEGMGYSSSIANTVFIYEKKGGNNIRVNAIINSGSFIAQYYSEEGSAQMVYTNSTSILKNIKSSSDDISASGQTVSSVEYEWADGDYKWNVDRDLKAKEPFFASGFYFDGSMDEAKNALMKGIAYQKTILDQLTPQDKEGIDRAHKMGVNRLLPGLYALDYSSLMDLAEFFKRDRTADGVFKSNLFNELLGAAGTTAAAMAVKDMIMQGKFDNDRDAAMTLTSVPFHIRRPNKQIVAEYEELYRWTREQGKENRFTYMAAPLVLGHLVRITCERAGQAFSADQMQCVQELAGEYAKKGMERYNAVTSREDKLTVLAFMYNMRWGGLPELMKPIVYGEVGDPEDYQIRSSALWAMGYGALLSGKAVEYFMPIFADRNLDHELRLGALEMIMWSQPKAANFATIMTVLYGEKDYEVINYAYTLFDRWATSINPCHAATGKRAKYFLKFMRQYSSYEDDYGFGVSKTYQRQFQKEKYGYGGEYLFYFFGSHQSTTPISLGMSVGNDMMDGKYMNHIFAAHLRIEGVAKGLVRKFKTSDPSTWKTADLTKILSGDMGIRERPNQPVRASITLMLKGTIILQRVYEEGSLSKDGKIGSFLSNLKGLGDTYSINHQRAVQIGAHMYEMPTTLGLPMVSVAGATTLGSVQATVKRGNHRGLLYRDIEYQIQFFTQASRATGILHPWRKATYMVGNDRIYKIHFPRKLVLGVNPIKKELKISVSRPSFDKPHGILMHSRTSVMVRGRGVMGDYQGLKEHCPSCENQVLVSRGADAIKSRVFVNRNNQKLGSLLKGEYFDCEMDISRGNTIRNLIGAMAPYNKNPKNAWTSIALGIRQIRTFFLYFPKNEQCGAYLRWSQSPTNPVETVEIAVRGNVEPNGERLFFRGRKWAIKVLVTMKGKPADRKYRLNIGYEFTPGYLNNNLKLQFQRAPLSAGGLEIKGFSACVALENSFPGFSKEFLGYDENQDMSVSGKAMAQYGYGSSCSDLPGEIRVNFKHSTTQAAREDLKSKWYYKECMAQKNTRAWAGRTTVPVSEECYATVWDATSARKYTWDIEFVKMHKKSKAVISKILTAAKAGLLPYWDVDPDEVEDSMGGDVGRFLNLDVEFKNSDKAMDISMETRFGEEKFNDIPLRLDWTKRLRNLKFTKTMKRLFDNKILSACIATSETVRTNDNVTLPVQIPDCWTLVSANCGPEPAYAVFSKKGSGLPLAAKVYVGGHTVEFNPLGAGNIQVLVNGVPQSIADQTEHEHKQDGTEIFKVFRWGNTYNVYSFLKVWVAYDGNFVEVVPAPSTKGQHCGVCGNFNRNKNDELTGKDGTVLADVSSFVDSWKWQC